MTSHLFLAARRAPARRPVLLAAVAAVLAAGLALPAAAQTSTASPAGQPAGPGYAAASAAFAALQRGDYPAAIAAATNAVAMEPGNRNYRLALVDAYVGAGQDEAALRTLEPLRQDPSYEVQSRLGSVLGQRDRQGAAAAFATAASTAPSADARAYAIRARVLALIEGGQVGQARSEYLAALASGSLIGSDPMDLAVIAVAVGEDRTAQPFYAEAAAAGALSGRAALDAGYSARRAHQDRAAIDYFSRGIDGVAAGSVEMTPEALFDVRRDVANLDRTWGGSGSISYGASSAASGIPTSPSSTDTLQAGVEVYRRLGGYRAGTPIDVFARVFETLDTTAGATGSESRQGWVGARWKPLAETNLVLEGSRMVKLGDAARNDWMVRASWSVEQGTDMRVDQRSWPMWRLYADASYIVNDQQTFGVVDFRAGRTFALSADGRTTASVFGSVGSNYDSALATSEAIGAGPGLSVRHWFRETAYAAPRSFVDLTVEYRFRLAGDDRAEGLFATLSVNY
jgi:tetratricopeptide (TPR) repeat protein